MLKDVLLVGLGGFLGSMLRFIVSTSIFALVPQAFIPLGTLSVNVTGSFIIGIIASLVSNNAIYFMAVTGFCGGFTTFSTLSLEVVDMFKLGEWRNAVIYIIMSFAICILITALGFWIGERYILK